MRYLLAIALLIPVPTFASDADAEAAAAFAFAKAARERKAPATPAVKPVPATKAGYPVRPKTEWWDAGSSWVNGQKVRTWATWQHLAGGEHKGKFPTDWLQGLSFDELQSLHSDDHEGRVKWDSVPGHGPATPAAKPAPPTPVPASFVLPSFGGSTCPGGNCPQPQRRGLFGWR
jgi:hypothetical protein